MLNQITIVAAQCLAAACFSCAATGQDAAPGASAATVSETERHAVVERIGEMLEERYVMPEVGVQCGVHLREVLAGGGFSGVDDPAAFAEALTDALRSVSHDQHLLVRPRAMRPSQDGVAAPERVHPLEARARRMQRGRLANYTFDAVERLEGNVGYLNFRFFDGSPESRATAAGAMAFLGNTDALIFDMRSNGGGDPYMVLFMCSYLFDEPTHVNSISWRQDDRTQEFWTFEVPGRQRADVPVFVLTSSQTFSGAEEFCYNLRTQKRATLVGETTRGGAHPGGLVPINERFEIVIPTGRAVNPVTGTNWERTGVEPHVAVDAEAALDTALELARPAAEAFRKSREAAWAAFDPWHIEVRRLDDDGRTTEATRHLVDDLRSVHAIGYVNEGDLNQYGYEFLGEERTALAIAAFELNAELYPTSGNVHDSLGEAYMAAGDHVRAIACYERALKLATSPEASDRAREVLKKLRAEPQP